MVAAACRAGGSGNRNWLGQDPGGGDGGCGSRRCWDHNPGSACGCTAGRYAETLSPGRHPAPDPVC
ncbi:hypothetical protein CJF30_00011115 [Rutstroemia sp. NJR-2017a BBW]|nr:hypothetical protein CJF30_00011115 [Rutstroemia sp. NJR-2017a BBW]